MTMRVPSTLAAKISLGIARPQPVIGSDMKDVADAVHGAAHGIGVADVAVGELQVEPSR
jgi:hypothetical protein